MRQRSRRLADDSGGNTKLRRAREQRILKGETRDEAESWREKNQREREDAKKGNFRGEEEETEKDRASSEEGKHGPCAGNCLVGVSRMVTNPIQSNQSSHLRLHHGKSFLLLSHPARKVVDLARATCHGESTSRVSILGLLERQLQRRLEGAATVYERVKRRASVAPIASLCHHRFHPSLTLCNETLLIAYRYPP
jgi:hypothetical protein